MEVRVSKKMVFDIEVMKETEKAVQLKVSVLLGQGGFDTGLWMPKSMVQTDWFFGKKVKELEEQLFDKYGKCAAVWIHDLRDGTSTRA